MGDEARHETKDKNHDQRLENIRRRAAIDAKFGFNTISDAKQRNAWLLNVQANELHEDSAGKTIRAAVDFYFLEDSGKRFKVSYPFRPYLYVASTEGHDLTVAAYISRRYQHTHVEHVEKDDLDLKNHLSGLKSHFIRVSFPSMHELAAFKKDLMPQVKRNKERLTEASDYTTLLVEHLVRGSTASDSFQVSEACEHIIDIREHDLPVHVRVAIDKRIFVGLWYTVVGRDPATNLPVIKLNETLVEPPDPVVCAFDLETTKMPLKFPDREVDQIMMISYMIDGSGYLIVNREIVAEEIEDFEYTPRPEFPGEFRVTNRPNERAVIKWFFDHLLRVQPSIMVTYNGDSFDWPFLEARAKHHGMDMKTEMGFYSAGSGQDEYYAHINCVHMDAYRWVQRDSYLPMGSQNLKAAAKAKLCYDPVELEPELMMEMAHHQPRRLASYSVSDAVATYYLYMKYVHPFVFALCTIIPMPPDEVLRKGSGTLCEALLMVEAYHKNIVFPNKQITKDHHRKMTEEGNLLESETYVGGHVEALECGVFRADIPIKFRLNVGTLQNLKERCEQTMRHSLLAEVNVSADDVENFDEVCSEICQQLDTLMEHPLRVEEPRIYHLDVGAMYPNIILTNRLQPPAVITEEHCLACIYNAPDAKCKKTMEWEWRGEIIPISRGDYDRLRQQLEQEKFGKPPRSFHALPKEEQQRIEKRRIQDYCRRAHGKLHLTREERRSTIICQRENAFYVDTVLAFRDRRYDYKALLKKAKAALSHVVTDDISGQKQAQARIVLYESMQLALKCILNSFYGYAMRKGSRWFSMEMAGIVCKTGADIITEARQLVEKVGRPLELDTDGIWCLLPASFPENFTFRTKSDKTVTLSYPGAVLNELLREKFTNHQYHTLKADGTYEVSSKNTILFEVDGPYLAMILPAAREEGKKLKKRYAVFSFDGRLAELKGFEVKRRGELAVIKHFQSVGYVSLSAVFKAFLKGDTLSEIYTNVAKEADYWLDILYSKGIDLSNEELFDLIGENRSMSKKLEEYGEQKSTSITTAKRLTEFLGDDMVKNSGLACCFIVSKYPQGAPVSERTLPLAIFKADPKICCTYLRKWTKNMDIRPGGFDVRELIDWSYYLERLGGCIQKIITIPAALQGVPNPVPRVPHPPWLENKRKERMEMHLQLRITDIFQANPASVPKNASAQYSSNNENRSGNEGEIEIISVQPSSREGNTAMPTLSHEPARLVRKTWAHDGFDEWLSYLKNMWWTQRAARKAALKAADDQMGASTSSLSAPPNFEMGGRKRKHPRGRGGASSEKAGRFRETLWHVIQIAQTKLPGQFTMFAVSQEGAMRQFNLTVPRTFYVDSLYAQEVTAAGRAVQKLLPNLRASSHLYEYSVDEGEFSERINELIGEMCSTRINGIYETQVPLLFKACMHVGSSCWLKSGRNIAALTLDNVQMSDRGESSYVDLKALRLLFFYEFTHANRTVMAFFSPSTSQGYIFIVNKVRVELQNVEALYQAEIKKWLEKRGENALVERCRGISPQCLQMTSQKEASQRLRALVRGLKLPPTDPAVFCVQSNNPSMANLCAEYPALVGFPHVRIRVSEPPDLMNVLDWGSMMTKRCIQHFLNSFIYLKDYSSLAHYIGIPLGNLPEDVPTLALDVLFARQLQAKSHILWASPSSKPDLGGKELEDLRMENDWENTSFRPNSGYVYNRESFEAKNVVAELHLGAVAVTALLQHGRVAQAEGSSEPVGFTSTDPKMSIEDALMNRLASSSYDGMGVNSALKILKDVFRELVHDIHLHSNVFADQLVVSMHRWIRNPNSLMYHPGISTALSNMMHKLCLLLVAEINRLGGTVIHCSLSRVILSTNRATTTSATTFIESLVQSLNQKKLFASLQLGTSHLASTFLWIDPNNYAFTHVNGVEDAENARQVRSRFALAEIFTQESGLTKVFTNLVAGYLSKVGEKAGEEKVSEEEFAKFCKDLFIEEITPSLFKLTTKMAESRSQIQLPRERRPVHMMGQENYDVAMEFVKGISKILSLNPHIAEELENVKSQMLHILHVKDASSNADWTPSPISAVFEHVYCARCMQSADLDLCFAYNPNSHTVGPLPFLCSQCKSPLPSKMVEEMLVERLSRIMLSYTLQDWRCKKCKKVGARSIAKSCECGSSFEGTVRSDEYKLTLRTIKQVAERHTLRDLRAVADELCGLYR